MDTVTYNRLLEDKDEEQGIKESAKEKEEKAKSKEKCELEPLPSADVVDKIRGDERIGLLTLAWAAGPSSRSWCECLLCECIPIGTSLMAIMMLIAQVLLVWAVGTEFPHGNVYVYRRQLEAGSRYCTHYKNASDVLAMLDSDGAFWENMSFPEYGIIDGGDFNSYYDMDGDGLDRSSRWMTKWGLLAIGQPLNTGPLTDKTMTLRGVSVRLRWAGTQMSGFDDATDCAGDAPLPLKIAIITVGLVYLLRSIKRIWQVYLTMARGSGLACLLKFYVRLFSMLKYFGGLFQLCELCPAVSFSRDQDGQDQDPYSFHPLMALDETINDMLFFTVIYTNAYLVYSAETPSEVVLNSLALEFVLELDDQIKKNILQSPSTEKHVAERIVAYQANHGTRLCFERVVNGIMKVFTWSFFASEAIGGLYFLIPVTLTCK